MCNRIMRFTDNPCKPSNEDRFVLLSSHFLSNKARKRPLYPHLSGTSQACDLRNVTTTIILKVKFFSIIDRTNNCPIDTEKNVTDVDNCLLVPPFSSKVHYKRWHDDFLISQSSSSNAAKYRFKDTFWRNNNVYEGLQFINFVNSLFEMCCASSKKKITHSLCS